MNARVPQVRSRLFTQRRCRSVGDFDHFAVDARRNHLFVSAEVHHSIEMFDLRTGEHLQSIPGFKTPHSVAFAAEKDDRIPLIDGSATGKGDSPDAAYYDAANHLLLHRQRRGLCESA